LLLAFTAAPLPDTQEARVVAHINPGLREALEGLTPTLATVSRKIHETPETSFQEHSAVQLVTRWLRDEGFEIEIPYAGLATSFRARRPQRVDGPQVAILLEYDALPEIGHGCGHNLIAAGGTAAAIAAARTLGDLAGSLTVIGTPAEEGGGGKILILEAGGFDDVDAALMFHPADRTLTARRGLAAIHFRARFHGKAAHAAKNPEDGRSALNGARLFLDAVDMLRQFMPRTARVHATFSNGGGAPNVVPAFAEIEGLVRDATYEGARNLFSRVAAAANGAAMATETTVEIDEPTPAYADRRNNPVMVERLATYLDELGVDVTPTSDENPAGSSDIGNVSRRVPAIHPYIQIAERGTPSHSEQFREAAATEYALTQVQKMALALAQLAVDLINDPRLLAAARADLSAATEPTTPES
jgi:amidohydrolase